MSSGAHLVKQQEPSRKDGREVEWQLASTDLGPVRRWLTDHGTIDGLVLEPRSTLQIFDTYLDTDDWRIHRAGFALRIRAESGKSEATLKSLHSASTEFADRRELTETLENPQSESLRRSNGPVGTRVHAVSGAHALLPLFEVHTSRQRFAIRREDEVEQLGEIALDETVISRPHGEPRMSMQRVEVEALTEAHEPLQSLVKTLRSDCALQAAPDTKYSQGLKSVGLAPGPAPQFAPATVDASMSIAEVALANLRGYLSAWHLHEPGARLGDDPEEMHDLRVAGRRLDAILRQFRSALPGSFLGIRRTLKRVLRSLGEARDLDVALGELETFGCELPESERESVEPLKRHLVAERGRARTRMLSVLDSVSVQKDLKHLASLLAAPSATPQQSSAELALNVAPQLIRRRYRKVRKAADLLTPDSSMEAYHEVRGYLKKLRYAVEAVAVIYGKPADEMLRALRRWQEKLGVQQDAAVAGRRLKTLAGAPPKGIPPETLFLMGRFAEHYASAASRARKLHAKGYKKVRGKWRRLRMTFEDLAVESAPAPPHSGP
jgi:CHAD domain-containing protein